MNKIKIIGIIVLLVFLAGFWIMGCTGEGVYDAEPQPTGTSSSPTPAPTSSVSPAPTPTGAPSEDLKELATGRANSFDVKVYTNTVAPKTKYVYWVEKSSTPSGSVFRIKADGTGNVEEIITGLESPSAFTVLAAEDTSRGKKGKKAREVKDYLLVSESGNPTNGVIYRVDLNDPDFPKTQITTGLQGDLTYMSVSAGYIYFTRDSGGTNSAIHRVSIFPENEPEVPDDIDTSVNYAYDVKAFYLSGNDEVQSFVLATERVASDGRVLMYNMTDVTEEGDLPVTPFQVSTSESYPTRVTFQPIYESDNVTPKVPMEGYVYWTNYLASSGTLVRQKVKYNEDTKAIEYDGVRQIVAQSLRYPYTVRVPNDFASGSLKGTLNKVIVSSNLSKSDGGNFYVIDVSDENEFPLTPDDNEVEDLLDTTVAYPLNAIIQYTSSTITMYFTSFNETTDGNNDGIIYYWQKTQ